MRTNSLKRGHGKNSRKARRIARAKARQEIWGGLSPDEKKAQMARNEANYVLLKNS